ncbi:cation:proton antiporter [Lentibacillus sp. Marseille-P4043]|uniref:cation:proton antiporter n=1 Tax=Lentibacillus sp. Marseille-P4043 TaxID=2040293 RepID=UPI001F31A16D|nr:sodium:proton antiporter [Lentibacillus sp. Marseille-P4043]
MNTALMSIVVVIALGIFSQWLAWRIQWPSIVIMSVAGLIIGPVAGLINPEQALGDIYSPLISLAVAVILFEGSSSLDVREIKDVSKSVLRIITIGVFITWVGGSLAAHYVAGLSLEIAFMIGGLFVVTGPTVIIPLLRQAKLNPRVAGVLKWEGIIVDPIGPLLALFSYEIFKVISSDALTGIDLFQFFLGAFVAMALGFIVGMIVSISVSKGWFPEYLKSAILLSFVLLSFAIAESLMHETGMLAVTIMGLTMAGSKKYVSSIGSIGHIVENISVILTSTVFILLAASLTRETLAQIFTWSIIFFVLIMLFIIRPLSIWISTIGTELRLAEKTLISWIAPRGIVALTVSGYFTSLLMDDGYAEASILTALTFALVFITVCAHGFTIGPVAKKLGLASDEPPGILLVGASSFAIALANHLKEMGTPVLISDTSSERLFRARELGIETYQGEILLEHAEFEVDLTPYNSILAMTGDAAYNALICQSYVPEFGYNHTFALTVDSGTGKYLDHTGLPPSLKANLLFGKGETFKELNRKINTEYELKTVEINSKKTVKKEDLQTDGVVLCIKKKNDTIDFVTLKEKFQIDEGDQLVILAK